jgi:iduronate 2-sulfatase
VRDFTLTLAPTRRGFLLREDRWAYIQYEEDASGGMELFEMQNDPKQYTNLALEPEHRGMVQAFRAKLARKLKEVRTNDLGISY